MGLSDKDIIRTIPIRRVGNRQEIAEICLFLTTDMAGLITSSTIEADGASWMADGSEEKRVEVYKSFMSKM